MIRNLSGTVKLTLIEFYSHADDVTSSKSDCFVDLVARLSN